MIFAALPLNVSACSGQKWSTDGNAIGKNNKFGTTNNQDLRIITNGKQRMVISARGKVGIGTKSPGAKLDIHVGSGGGAAIGYSCSATGNYAIAKGYTTAAKGSYSTLLELVMIS